MSLRAPAFWFQNPPTWRARALAPLGALYATATARRLRRGPRVRLDIPVICIGNLNAGGTGKTPTTIALAQMLAARGVAAHIVSRGYGGQHRGTWRVDERQHNATLTGDEPLLMSSFAPVWVCDNRAEGARAAQAAGAQAILLDDGFQDPALAHDLTLITVDAAKGFGNGLCLPAGPLREPVPTGLSRADLLLSIGPDSAQTTFSAANPQLPLPRLQGELAPLAMGIDWPDQRVLAFAGIGHPEKFFATLRQTGAEIARTEALDDHQTLTAPLMRRLLTDAQTLNAQLVTTEKDAVRLPPELRAQVLTLPVRLSITDDSALSEHLTALNL